MLRKLLVLAFLLFPVVASADQTLSFEFSGTDTISGGQVNQFSTSLVDRFPLYTYWQISSGFNEAYVGPHWPMNEYVDIGLAAGLSEAQTIVRYRLAGYASLKLWQSRSSDLSNISSTTIFEHGPHDTWYRNTTLVNFPTPVWRPFSLGVFSQTGLGTGAFVQICHRRGRMYEGLLSHDKHFGALLGIAFDW